MLKTISKIFLFTALIAGLATASAQTDYLQYLVDKAIDQAGFAPSSKEDKNNDPIDKLCKDLSGDWDPDDDDDRDYEERKRDGESRDDLDSDDNDRDDDEREKLRRAWLSDFTDSDFSKSDFKDLDPLKGKDMIDAGRVRKDKKDRSKAVRNDSDDSADLVQKDSDDDDKDEIDRLMADDPEEDMVFELPDKDDDTDSDVDRIADADFDDDKHDKRRRKQDKRLMKMLEKPDPNRFHDWAPNKADREQNGGFATAVDNGFPVPYNLNGWIDIQRKLPWEKED